MRHPAKFTDSILKEIQPLLLPQWVILDPFGGTGKLKEIAPNAVINEIEFEWATMGKPSPVINGDALSLPFADETFDALVTSPTYSNRMADSHNAKDGSKRNTYKHTLGRDLHPNNSGQLQWSEKYKRFHEVAWLECDRVLKENGFIFLNISNHIRKGEEIDVSYWHLRYFITKGYHLFRHITVETPRLRFGQNATKRVSHENIFVLEKT